MSVYSNGEHKPMQEYRMRVAGETYENRTHPNLQQGISRSRCKKKKQYPSNHWITALSGALKRQQHAR